QQNGEIPAAVFSYTAKTSQYVYDPTTWQPTWSNTEFRAIKGQDFGPNGEVMLVEANAWASGLYQVDPVIRMYASLPATLPPSPPTPTIPPPVLRAIGVSGTVPAGVTDVLAVGSDAGGPGIARLVDPTTGNAYLIYKDPAFGSVGGMRVVA